MKKYFCKFLPVEGEIKEGDKFFWSGDSKPIPLEAKTVHKGEIDYDSPGYPEVCCARTRECKKVKLFLCSRDIQIGDRIRYEGKHYQSEAIVKGFNKLKQPFLEKDFVDALVIGKMEDYPEDVVRKSECFKVIGEISPEAKWVKEGDEFDEEDVRKAVIIELYYADASEQWQYFTKYLKVTEEYKCRKENLYHETITDERLEIKCPNCKTFH